MNEKKYKPRNYGSKNGMWKGINVGYKGLHSWVYRYLKKPIFCTNCKERKKLEAANISGEYKREIIDWKWLCRKCHMESDGRLKNLIERNKTPKGK